MRSLQRRGRALNLMFIQVCFLLMRRLSAHPFVASNRVQRVRRRDKYGLRTVEGDQQVDVEVPSASAEWLQRE